MGPHHCFRDFCFKAMFCNLNNLWSLNNLKHFRCLVCYSWSPFLEQSCNAMMVLEVQVRLKQRIQQEQWLAKFLYEILASGLLVLNFYFPFMLHRFSCLDEALWRTDAFSKLTSICLWTQFNIFGSLPLPLMHTLMNTMSKFSVLLPSDKLYILSNQVIFHWKQLHWKIWNNIKVKTIQHLFLSPRALNLFWKIRYKFKFRKKLKKSLHGYTV